MLPDIEREEKTGSKSDLEPGWLVICWNDPVNLMTYVTHVFQTVFGWNKQKAEHHMLQVHRQGKSVLARTPHPGWRGSRPSLRRDREARRGRGVLQLEPGTTKPFASTQTAMLPFTGYGLVADQN